MTDETTPATEAPVVEEAKKAPEATEAPVVAEATAETKE